MADTGKQSPLGVNVLGSLLAGHDITSNNTTFYINPVAQSYYGKSINNNEYEPGKIVNETCLKWITYALSEAWSRTPMNGVSGQITPQAYDAMLNIGQSRLAALGNSKPPTYQVDDPTGFWVEKGGPANTGLAISGNIDHGQEASWDPWDSGYDPGNPSGPLNPNSEVTKWGWVRAMALQAYNEFYFNAKVTYNTPTPPNPPYSAATIDDNPSYKDFTNSFLIADGFVDYSNEAIYAVQNSQTFLLGTYSNQDDLTSADITGISLSARAFGQDLINLGKSINLQDIGSFGLPSNLLKVLQTNKALTQPVILAALASGLSQSEILDIANGVITPTKDQEQKLYGAFLVIVGSDLAVVLKTLNCKTKKIVNLADLLSIKKLFPLSYRTLTVPIYNTEPNPTNSKTYYLLFINDELNPQLVIPRIKEIVGTIVPPVEPPLPPPPAPPPPLPIPEPTPVDPPLPPPAPIIEPVVVQPTVLPVRDPTPIIVAPPPPAPEVPAPQPPVPVTPVAPPPPVSGGGCPAPWIKITLSDKTTIEAGQIEVGMYVYTKHETTGDWGTYKVTAKEICTDDRWIVKFENGAEFVGTYNHRVLTDKDWVEIRNLHVGDKVCKEDGYNVVVESKYCDYGDVIKITVEDAHTFLTEGLVSHNVKFIGGGGCVALESFIPLVEVDQKHNGREITKAWMLEAGMKISLGTDDLEIVDGQVIKTLNDYQPCVRISTVDGITLVCSTTAPIYTKDQGFIPATEVFGKRVAVMRNGKTWFDEVVGLEDVGMKFVRVIDAGNNSFWAGERPGSFILHHNVPIRENLDFDKK